MKYKNIPTALLLAGVLLMTACGGETEAQTEPVPETEAAETIAPEIPEETETEPETESETETKKQPETFTNYTKLTLSESDTARYDAGSGTFLVWFTEENVRYRDNDACAIGISGDGEAYSVPGTIDVESHPEFANGDYYTGIAVKPGDVIYDGTYTVTITFAEYMVSFPCTIG
ncbi:MAG: hypothetical protein IKY52_03765 [Clostridia bacterium]|nr:hypothetical protein [Clostridia bacterium]